MAIQHEINGVLYKNIPSKSLGSVMDSFLTQANINGRDTDTYLESGDLYPLVNAIDIDWNGVTMKDGSELNTTSDLVNVIESKANASDITDINSTISSLQSSIETEVDSINELKESVTTISLEYAKTADVADTYQVKGDYLTEHQDLSDYAKTADVADTYQVKGDYLTEHQDLSDYATKTYVSEQIESVVGAAPEALDTLQEIAEKLTDNDDVVAALTSSIAEKVNTGDLATVATSGSYNDLTDTPTNVSAFTNDAGYLTEHQDLSEYAKTADVADTYQVKGDYLTEHQDLSEYATKTYVSKQIESVVNRLDEIEELIQSYHSTTVTLTSGSDTTVSDTSENYVIESATVDSTLSVTGNSVTIEDTESTAENSQMTVIAE